MSSCADSCPLWDQELLARAFIGDGERKTRRRVFQKEAATGRLLFRRRVQAVFGGLSYAAV
jgi:hypothetical protein